MTDQSRAADLLAARLYEAGCRFAFGMPGGEVLTLIDALEYAGIRFVLCKHENAAGFMAEGMHHCDGAPAILVATIGPGAMNGVNVVANALQDRVPLIVLTGCVDADEAQRYTHQVMDHQAVFAPITKASFRLTAHSADIIADRAVGVATQGRSGPVHIDVPMTVADTRVARDRRHRRAVAAPLAPAPGPLLDQARDWLATATRPVMIVGLDAVKDAAGPAILHLAQTRGIPVITTYKAKGIIPESHPLCLGAAGLSPLADRHLLPLVRAADLVLCVGYDPIEMRQGWMDVWTPDETRVIDITAVPNDHYMHQAGINIIADCAATLAALSDGLPPAQTWPDDAPDAAAQALANAFPTDDVWGAAAVIDECARALPQGTIATVDSGAHRILLSQMWRCDTPRSLLQSSGLCTMGCAVPLAMGAALAQPDRPVVSFSGDAGMLMVAGELATAAELGLRTIFVVFVDASLALIELKQRQRQMRNAGVDFARHDFADIGRAFGGVGVTVSDRAGLHAAVSTALKADRFTVIAAEIDRQSYDGRI